MKTLFCLVAWAVLMTGVSVQAEFYEYVDKNGVRSYTDDPTRMSVEQRKDSTVLQEVKSESRSGTSASSPQRQQPVSYAEKKGKELSSQRISEKMSQALNQEAQKLNQIKKELEKEYSRLKSEKRRLLDLRDELRAVKKVSNATMENYRDQVNRLNRQTETYEKRHRAFAARVQTYNDQLK